MTAVLIPPPKIESLSHFEDVDLVILGEEYGDDLFEEISSLKYVYNLAGGNDNVAIRSISESSELHLNSGSGNDTIVLNGEFGNCTILGGQGKDKIKPTHISKTEREWGNQSRCPAGVKERLRSNITFPIPHF